MNEFPTSQEDEPTLRQTPTEESTEICTKHSCRITQANKDSENPSGDLNERKNAHMLEWCALFEEGKQWINNAFLVRSLHTEKESTSTERWGRYSRRGSMLAWGRKRPYPLRIGVDRSQSREVDLERGLNEINRMTIACGVSEAGNETATVLYRRTVVEGFLSDSSVEAMATACLYAGASLHETSHSLEEFSSVSRANKGRIQQAYRQLTQEFTLDIGPADPVEYVPGLVSELGLSEETERVACELLDLAKAQDVHIGKSPIGLAAGALYGATYLTKEALTQAEVSEAGQVAKITIRKRYQELLELRKEHETSPFYAATNSSHD